MQLPPRRYPCAPPPPRFQIIVTCLGVLIIDIFVLLQTACSSETNRAILLGKSEYTKLSGLSNLFDVSRLAVVSCLAPAVAIPVTSTNRNSRLLRLSWIGSPTIHTSPAAFLVVSVANCIRPSVPASGSNIGILLPRQMMTRDPALACLVKPLIEIHQRWEHVVEETEGTDGVDGMEWLDIRPLSELAHLDSFK